MLTAGANNAVQNSKVVTFEAMSCTEAAAMRMPYKTVGRGVLRCRNEAAVHKAGARDSEGKQA
jgi:hypothetical protein